jgi:hypothetical protein
MECDFKITHGGGIGALVSTSGLIIHDPGRDLRVRFPLPPPNTCFYITFGAVWLRISFPLDLPLEAVLL